MLQKNPRGRVHQTTEIAMGKPLIRSSIMMFVLACGPEAGDESDIQGKLEYEQLHDRVYRIDRRIDASFETENGERQECGILTDRAYDELESTLAALDPNVDYGEHPDDCDVYSALVHVDGFEHSPFECNYACCHADLYWAAVVYSMILNNFWGAIRPSTASPTSPSSPISRARRHALGLLRDEEQGP
jgi:hypothetical protein